MFRPVFILASSCSLVVNVALSAIKAENRLGISRHGLWPVVHREKTDVGKVLTGVGVQLPERFGEVFGIKDFIGHRLALQALQSLAEQRLAGGNGLQSFLFRNVAGMGQRFKIELKHLGGVVLARSAERRVGTA